MIRVSERNGKKVFVVKVLDREFSLYNCRHLPGCDLSRGTLSGSTITCSCGWQYDLLTGRALNQPLASLERAD